MTKSRPIIAPSLLAADFMNLQNEVEMINDSNADWLHLDVMDGSFVPNISFGISIINQVTSVSSLFNDVHLMINEPENYFPAFVDAGADLITFHLEATNHVHRAIQQLHDLGVKAGIALNPHTPVEMIKHIVADVDLVCLMSVNPGFGGQKFIPETVNKIKKCRELILKANSNCLIEVDGGVGLKNAEMIVSAGADVLVAGSAVFKAEKPHAVISQLKKIKPLLQTV